MKVGVILGLGLGIIFICGCAPGGTDATAPPVAAPTSLVPESYAALPAAVALAPPAPPPALALSATDSALAPIASPPAPARAMPAPAPAPAFERPATPLTAVKSAQYHPYWMIDVH